jgi:ABC-2 type transport system permease protein
MLRSVWTKTLRDYRRSLVWWGLGVVGLVAMYAAIWPTISDMPDIDQFLEAYPEALQAFFGGGGADLSTPEGYLQMEGFSFLFPTVFLIFAIGAAAGAIAGEEDRGTLELVLAAPVRRRRIVLEKMAAIVVAVVGLGVLLWLALRLGALAAGMEISAGRLAAGTASLVLFTLVFAALALLVGAATGSRGLALGVAASLAVLSYVVTSLAVLVDALEVVNVLSPYHYYADAQPLRDGLDLVHALVLLGLGVLLTALAVPAFDRRDAKL